MTDILQERERQVYRKGEQPFQTRLRKTERGRARSASAPAFSAARASCSIPSPTLCTSSTGPSDAPPTPGTSAARFFRPAIASAELLHRLAGNGRDSRRREETVRGAVRVDRRTSAQGGVRLRHLHRRHYRRRRGRDLQAGQRGERHSRASGPFRGIQGHKEGRLSRRLRCPVSVDRNRFNRRHQSRSASTSWATSTWPARSG